MRSFHRIQPQRRGISLPLDAVLSALREAPFCLSCIARTANITPLRALSVLADIGLQVVIIEAYKPCHGCGRLTDTHHAPHAAGAHPADLTGVAILIVDDHEDTVDL